MDDLQGFFGKKRGLEFVKRELESANGKASKRTLDCEDCMRILQEYERFLQDADVRKSAMPGLVVTLVGSSEKFPNAYRYTPETTAISFVRAKSGWKVVAGSGKRQAVRTKAGNPHLFVESMPDEVRCDILGYYACY